MTPLFQNIAIYVVDHHHELAFASAARLAALTGSSPATVVRFAEFLGLSGFTELQSLARHALRAEVNTVTRLQRTMHASDPRSVLEATLRADLANLEAMLAKAPAEAFERAVALLAGTRRIHLVGLRSTHGLICHFQSYLTWIGRSGNVLKPGIADLPDQLLAVEPGDVCVAVSLRRYTRATLQIAEAARAAGARVIAITDSELSPLAELADTTLLVPVQFPAFFESKTAVLSLMNALVLGLSMADRKRTVAALKLRERSWFGQETYANENFRTRLMQDMEAFANTGEPGPAGPRAKRPARERRRKTTLERI